MKKTVFLGLASVATAALALLLLDAPAQAGFPKSPNTKCAADAVVVGSVCMDKYEASVWRIPATNMAGDSNAGLIKKVRKGTADGADLLDGDATQLGTASDDYAPCSDNAQTCKDDIYAVSLLGMMPARFITWLQANIACANSGKRLPTTAQWQMAVTGSPDLLVDNATTDCNIGTVAVAVNTGSRSSCVSAFGAFDIVGNLDEFVADWVPASTTCPGWGGFSNDAMCLSGASTTALGPGVLLRGGSWSFGTTAGPLSVTGNVVPWSTGPGVGFRCAR